MTGNDDQSHVTNKPFEAYEGDEPYIFVSYKHSDYKIVYPVIKRLHDAGFNIWYDAGLSRGKNYDIQIANHIVNAALFITFITEEVINCASDEDDYLIKELTVANNAKIEKLPIYLENVQLEGFYLMHYLGKQSILKFEYGNNEDMFIDACVSAFENDFGIQLNADPGLAEDNLHVLSEMPNFRKNESYMFVSYSLREKSEVLLDIERFQQQGYNILYDGSIATGGMWFEEMQKAIINCSLFVMYVSDSSMQSASTTQQLFLALEKNIPVVFIFLEDPLSLPNSNLFMAKSAKSIPKYMMSDEEYVKKYVEVFKELGFENNID